MPGFDTISPVDGSVVCRRSYTPDEELASVLARAKQAEEAWASAPLAERRELCLRFVDAMLSEKDAIALELTRQMGRPIQQSPSELRGFEERARRMRAEADREAVVIVANARRDAETARGTGDAEAARIFAEAYGQDPEFYAFLRSLEAYGKTLGKGTTLVLSPDAEFFRFIQSAGPATPRGE